MKTNKSNNIIFSLLVLIAILSSCKKESENTYTIFKSLEVNFKEAIANDEVYVEFKLEKAASGSNMAKVVVKEPGGSTPVYSKAIAYSDRYLYSSGVIILKTSNPSTVSYQIAVLDSDGNDITPQVTISYPAGKLIVSNPVLITDKEIKTVDEGTTAYIDYNIHSEEANIKSVWLESFATGTAEPARVTIATLPDNITDSKNYRGVARVSLNRDGKSKFRIYVTNEANDYIGDGYTSINANVATGFELAANKFIYAIDTAATLENPDLTSACFYSISKKSAYNYTDAKSISADIDFGIYLTKTGSGSIPYSLNFTSINNSANPLAKVYDFSSWVKRQTLFGPSTPSVAQLNGAQAIPAPEVFNTVMVSGATIKQAVGAGRYANLINRVVLNAISIGSIIYFKTPEGKYGAIFINGFGKNYQGKYYVNIDVKIEK